MNLLSNCTRSQPLCLTRLTHVPIRSVATSFMGRPSPPPLPHEQQREFEDLVRKVNQPASGVGASVEAKLAEAHASSETLDEIHPDARRLPPAEFEGDVNPATGEQGGPKIEPLKHGDWSYGGRITDF